MHQFYKYEDFVKFIKKKFKNKKISNKLLKKKTSNFRFNIVIY